MVQAIGLTGGIGSGKSVVATMLRHMGYAVYIADVEASRLIDQSAIIRRELIESFGRNIYTLNGTLDKKQLADIIFKNQEKLKLVNEIVHPQVIQDFQQWQTSQTSHFVFFESAILYENNLERYFNAVICVAAPLSLRLKRVIDRDATSEAKVKERIKNQLEDKQKCKLADFILYNDGNHLLLPQLLNILNQLSSLRQSNAKS